MCLGTVDPRTESTHVIEPRIMCALVRVPTSSICLGASDPRTESTHVIEPRIMCALVGTPAPRTESTHLWYVCGYYSS